jgi:GNAT superfamily N-acetyltransferase
MSGSPSRPFAVRPFRRSDREQVTDLVNDHAAAVMPGVSTSVNAVLAQFEREPDEFIVGPWVAERQALVAEQDGAVVAATLLSRYRDDPDVGPGYRGAGELRWLLFRPEAPSGNPFWGDGRAAAEGLMQAALARFAAWRVTRVFADGTLPVPAVHGVPEQWPHVADLYSRNGFIPDGDGVEVIHLVRLAELEAAGTAPGSTAPQGTAVRRSVGINGTRFTAVRDGADLGLIEVALLDPAERHPRQGGLADIGNLHVAEPHRRQGIGSLLLGHAARWLRLGGADRLLHYAWPSETAAIGFVEKHGFAEVTRTRRGWQHQDWPHPG